MVKKYLWVMTGAVLLIAGGAAVADEVEYFAIIANGKKIGHVTHVRRVQARKVITTHTMTRNISRLGEIVTSAMTEENTETLDGKPLAFKIVQSSSTTSQVTEGKVNANGKVTVIGGTTAQIEPRKADWPQDALLSEGISLLQKSKGLKENLTYSYVQFDPDSLRGYTINVRMMGRKEVDILGRRETLWEIQSNSGGVLETIYVNDNFKMRKDIIPEGSIKMEIVACTKRYALSKDAALDVMKEVLLASPKPLPNLSAAGSIKYHLSPQPQARLIVPSYDNQKVVADPSGLTVTVTAQKMPEKVPFPYKGNDKTALEALNPSTYLECKDPNVIALARQAIGSTKDAAVAAQRIEASVRNYITTKDYSVGWASASEVIKTRRGDCTEHAVLAAALCRAVGIPAQVVAGMSYADKFGDRRNVFVPHAWMRAYLGNQWINFDAALAGYDLGHIAMGSGDGDPDDYVNLGRVMGVFRIDAATIQTTKPAPAPTLQAPMPRRSYGY